MSVDRSELQALIRDLGAVPPAVRRTLRSGFVQVGQPVLQEMRRRASWSTRIPGATSMTQSGTALGLRFRVDSGPAPHARPYENDGSPGTFRHPVYGHRDRWVSQEARPFFYGVVADKADEVRDAIGDIIMQAAHENGF